MGQVVDIKKRESGFVKYLHRAGWEKGFKIKGKWEKESKSLMQDILN